MQKRRWDIIRKQSKFICVAVLLLCGITVISLLAPPIHDANATAYAIGSYKEYVEEGESVTNDETTQEVTKIHTQEQTSVCKKEVKYKDIVTRICEKYDVPVDLILAVIYVESKFDPNAISATEDYGLMQINRVNHAQLEKDLGITNILNPAQNIESGVYIFSKLLNKYSESEALMAYNLGESGAKRLWAQGVYETEYTREVQAAKQTY